MSSSSVSQLRLLTYLVPEMPLGLYQTYQYYLEEALGIPVTLMVESRWRGPTRDRPDPFATDQIDLAFMCSAAYLRQLEKRNTHLELLPAAPIHIHPKSNLQPVYFADVIVHADRKSKLKDFLDLKGFRWGYSDDISLSGNFKTLAELKKLGFDASFFGEMVKTGSHMNSIQRVLNHEIDATAVDANVLNAYLLQRPDQRKNLHVLCSWGPMPIQPLVVNTALPGDMKEKITSALLKMNSSKQWREELSKFNVWGFKSVDSSIYNEEKTVKDMVKNMSTQVIYY